MMKKFLSFVLAFAILGSCILGLTSCGEEEPTPSLAIIEVEDFGTITVKLYPQNAPITVANFVSLAEEHFYDGLTFHRIISGFMIQGGDPLGNGTGGSSQTIKGEFSENGVTNTLSHARGVISMARSSAYDSASSQFFICHENSTHLDGLYAAFGRVVDGMDVVDAIASVEVDSNDKPYTPVVITTIRIEYEE